MEYPQKTSFTEKRKHFDTEVITTNQILLRPVDVQEKLRGEIENLHTHAFPKISEKLLNVYVSDYFTQGNKNFQRQAILFRNKAGQLIATNICNCGEVEYNNSVIKGVYLISSAVLPEYQGHGIGKNIGVKLLTEFKPDVLFTTSSQSSALHSRINLFKKGLVTGYEVYPRLEQTNEGDVLITLPFKDLDFAINAFKQTYLGVVEGEQELIDDAIRNLTVFMVRKNVQGEMYDFNPWEKSGREDKLAKTLGVTSKDSVLVMFRKKTV